MLYSCAVYPGFSDLPGRQPCFFCLVGSGHVVCASIHGCVGAVCWHLKLAVVALPRWKTSHVCRETVPFCISITSAALHKVDGLFLFPRQFRQNLKVVKVQGDVRRTPYLICHRVDYSQSQKSSTFHCLTGMVFPKELEFIMSTSHLKRCRQKGCLSGRVCEIAAGLNDCDEMRRWQ